MKIQVRAVNVSIDRETRSGVERRVQAGLGRLAHLIRRVGVRIVDQNGPRGGEDIACLVEVHLRPTGSLFIEETDIDLVTAVNGAAGKAALAVARAVEKRREMRRKAPASLRGGRPAHPSFG